jgi:hypothetical protein
VGAERKQDEMSVMMVRQQVKDGSRDAAKAAAHAFRLPRSPFGMACPFQRARLHSDEAAPRWSGSSIY